MSHTDYHVKFLYALFAADIADKVEEQLQKLKKEKVLEDWNSKVLGGGRISHDPDTKAIKVYGYSQVKRKQTQLLLELAAGRGNLSSTALEVIFD